MIWRGTATEKHLIQSYAGLSQWKTRTPRVVVSVTRIFTSGEVDPSRHEILSIVDDDGMQTGKCENGDGMPASQASTLRVTAGRPFHVGQGDAGGESPEHGRPEAFFIWMGWNQTSCGRRSGVRARGGDPTHVPQS